MRWRLIKSRFSHLYQDHGGLEVPVSRKSKQERTIWQRRYWEHTIDDEDDLDNHIDYIHINPVHHGMVKYASRMGIFIVFQIRPRRQV